MNMTDNLVIDFIESLAKKFESSSETLHNRDYGFWNTVTESLTSDDVKIAFDRDHLSDELKRTISSPDLQKRIQAQIKFYILGGFQQDYSRRYLSNRRHAMTCAGNQFDRVSRDMRYIYTTGLNDTPKGDNTAQEYVEQEAFSKEL